MVERTSRQKTIGSWGTRKLKHGLHKACFVVKGYLQRPGFETFCWCHKTFNITRNHGCVKMAFFYWDLEEEFYMEQSDGHVIPGRDHVLLLLKSFYGLKQDSNVWFKIMIREFVKLGWGKYESDHGIWIKYGSNGERTFVILYVHNLLSMSEDDDELANFKPELEEFGRRQAIFWYGNWASIWWN